MQRSLGSTYSSAKKKNRVNSVVRGSRMEITTIEEVPMRMSKFKRQKQDHKGDSKLVNAYQDSKVKKTK